MAVIMDHTGRGYLIRAVIMDHTGRVFNKGCNNGPYWEGI
jgi:hypothetical protein